MKITVGSGELAYDEAGCGPAVVLVHAGLADRRMWEPQFAALAQHYRVIGYDWRGYGESGDAAGEVSRHGDLLGLLDALGLESAALVGCSYGGAHALDAALAEPGRVTALALVCAAISGYQIWTPGMTALAAAKAPSRIPPGRLAAYDAHTARAVDPADVAAMAAANVRLMVVGPYREPGALDPAVHERALEMCRGVFWRQWAGPAVTELDPQPPALGRLAEVRVPALIVNGSWSRLVATTVARITPAWSRSVLFRPLSACCARIGWAQPRAGQAPPWLARGPRFPRSGRRAG
jgi:pimeloyl-ACP methyl ester carboxylesterase